MSKVEYVGPRVEISNHGVTYRYSKEDKYIYLAAALEILKDIDNDYDKQPYYSHECKNIPLKQKDLRKTLKRYEESVEECITEECRKYKLKRLHEMEHILQIPHLTQIDKEVWIKNIEIMQKYRVQRAINKMYYMHTIQDIIKVIKHKKIKELYVPFNKNFFHVLNTLKGTLITGKPSFDAMVIEEYNKDDIMVLKLTIRN
jgi:ribosomal 30S subunit maturation factor RimM